MIDIESIVFDTVYNAVIAEFPTARVDAGYIEKSATFPAVEVIETNSVPVRDTNTDDNAENYTRLYYEVNIYSDKQNTAKSEARAIAKVVDDAMQSLKCYRTMMHQLPNQDRTIFRLYMRYEVVAKAITDKDGEITGYKFYRR
jgi:hypothetical protein